MSKFDEFNLDIKGEGNGSASPKIVTVDPYICTTTAVTMLSCGGSECCQSVQGCGTTNEGCSGDTNSACRSYCGGGCRMI